MNVAIQKYNALIGVFPQKGEETQKKLFMQQHVNEQREVSIKKHWDKGFKGGMVGEIMPGALTLKKGSATVNTVQAGEELPPECAGRVM